MLRGSEFGLSFGQQQFGEAALGDVRRTQRLVELADAFLRQPDASLPRKCGSPANYQALLALLARPEVTHASVSQSHRQFTYREIQQRTGRTTLLIGDITELDFTSQRSLRKQLGPIGNGGGFGYECFNLLAVDPESRTVIGLADQLLFRRRRRKLTRAQVRQLPVAKRQSGLWVRATRNLPSFPEGARTVRVFDREGDTDEALRAPGHYLIRSRTDRRISVGADAGTAVPGKLHTYLRSLPATGRREVVLEPAPGRAGRTIACGVSYAPIWLHWSKANGSPGDEPTRAFGVRVWELNPPRGEEGLEWLLLTSVAVASVADAQQRGDWYECRWVVEEYHKALKTGVRIEKVQLRKRDRLEPLLGLLSVVALDLLWIRDAARDPSRADLPAEQLVEPVLVELAARSPTGIKIRGDRMTVREFYQAVARLGGYLGNFAKKPPGWQTLWHGWKQLNMMAQGLTTRPPV
jgi:transposase-like protein/DDE family transposase